MPTLAEQAVDAMQDISGRHPGYRAVHAKGILCKGTFTASPEAAGLTRAAHMQGDPIDVTVRFSNATGNPNAPDGVPDGRGMATKFYLPDGSRTDIVAVTLPCFMVRTPEDFIKFTRARKPSSRTGKPRTWKIGLYVLTHRESRVSIEAARTMKPVPSYANCRYNGIHAFKWVGSDGGERYVRYSWLPEAGEDSISREEAKQRDRDFLQRELGERLARGPFRFTLQLQLAAPGDPIEDATAIWPEEREKFTAGTLELTELETGRETGQDVLVFDPTRVIDGIELSGDPILHFRTHAYSVSVERRSGVPRPPELDASQ
jgi:catalase